MGTGDSARRIIEASENPYFLGSLARKRTGDERMKGNMHGYPKVYAVGHRYVAELFMGDVLVEEKVDGSQFSFSRVNGEVFLRSRGAVVYAESPGMFAAAVKAVDELGDRLTEGWVYRAEYLMKPKHNVLAYERVPKFNLILFDINIGEETYLTRAEKEAEAERLGLEIVPVMYFGPVTRSEDIYAFLERDSILGGHLEGVVIKNYARFGEDKKVLMGKFVREDFKETHSKEWKANNPTISDVIERIIATLRSEVRWAKSAQRLRDAGKLDHSPRDIGMLIKETQSDIRAEELDFISSKLVEFALPRVLRASTAGLPEWYKRTLLESAFVVPTEETMIVGQGPVTVSQEPE
jgi:hypothetical protein